MSSPTNAVKQAVQEREPPNLPTAKQLLKPVRRRFAALKRTIRIARAKLAGTHQCPVCEERYRFEPFGEPPRQAARCPGCGSLERHRLLWLYLDEEILPKRSKPCRILHCAPEPCLRRRLGSLPGTEYASIDLSAENGAIAMDLTDLWFRDQIFDLVICSHVLEHIPDDRRAMRELNRVTKIGSVALLIVPDDPELAETYEDHSINTPEARRIAFGQHDHVRIYSSNDYVKRLTESGWVVTGIRYANRLAEQDLRRFSIPVGCDETIYRCVRS